MGRPRGLGAWLRALAVSAAAAAGCSAEPGDGTIGVTAIELRQSGNAPEWAVRYRLARPATTVVFPRNAVLYRAAKWQLPEEFEIVLEPGRDAAGVVSDEHAPREALRRRDGQPFASFEAAIPTLFDTWPNEYPQNYSFTDGSVLFYTGHLVVEALADRNASHTLTLVAADGGPVIVRGQRAVGSVRVPDPGDNGVFAFFGAIEPVRSANFVGVIDPGLPRWLASALGDHLPGAFDYFAERFDRPLPRTPAVYVNFQPGDFEAMHFKGGALDDATFSLSLVGDAWRDADPGMRHAVPLHIVHEAVHLWNLRLATGERIGSWMHEGGAELMSWLALRETGYLSEADYGGLVCGAARECSSDLDSRSLHAAEQAGDLTLSYACGALIADAIDSAARAGPGGQDLFDVTRQALAALPRDEPNTVGRYLDTIERSTGAAGLRGTVEALVAGPAAAAALEALTAGVPACP